MAECLVIYISRSLKAVTVIATGTTILRALSLTFAVACMFAVIAVVAYFLDRALLLFSSFYLRVRFLTSLSLCFLLFCIETMVGYCWRTGKAFRRAKRRSRKPKRIGEGTGMCFGALCAGMNQ